MRIITLDSNKTITSIKNVLDNYVLQENELVSELGELGQVQKTDGTFTEPIKTLDEIKKDKVVKLQQSYYASFTTFQSSALGTLKTYPIDLEAQKNFNDYQNRLIADSNKDSFYFKTLEDGTLINHTRLQFLQLMEDGELFKVNQTIKINNLVNQVKTATTIDEVNAIVW
jgi:hypothetical protein